MSFYPQKIVVAAYLIISKWHISIFVNILSSKVKAQCFLFQCEIKTMNSSYIKALD